MKTTSSIEIQRLFEERIDNPLLNTSYPLSPDDWAKYSCPGQLPFASHRPIAFYIHIPFCKQICSFCEYTKMCTPSKELQRNYINALIHDIELFVDQYPDMEIYGFDIGGGTPTALDAGIFAGFTNWLSNFISDKKTTPDFEPSIEGSFNTLVDDYWGSHRSFYIAKAGIKRLSLGLQSTSNDVLKPLHRNCTTIKDMCTAIDYWHRLGIEKINIDLMYGLPGQDIESIKKDIAAIRELNPEQVTIYEFRTNQINISHTIDLDKCHQQYCELYEGLSAIGYDGDFGRNTFSRDLKDCGLSSYLRHRMYDGWQYKGFGISAQSMSQFGVSYNVGKNRAINKLVSNEWLSENGYSYEANEYYKLPRQELLSKFVAISGYSGGFSLSSAREVYGEGFNSQYKQVIEFLLAEGLVAIYPDRIQFTRKGFRYYGAILSLFYSSL